MQEVAATQDDATAVPDRSLNWRVIDYVIVAVLGAVTGLIFVAWNNIGGAWFGAADAATPGLGGIAVGIWLIGGVLGGLIIRKPGAALAVELIGATVSAAIGNVWGVTTIYSGLAQGLGAEVAFLIFGYRRFGISVAALAGVLAGAFAWVLELFVFGNIEKTAAFNTVYLVSLAVSGAVLAGVLGWLLVRALVATGALNRFAAGQERSRRV